MTNEELLAENKRLREALIRVRRMVYHENNPKKPSGYCYEACVADVIERVLREDSSYVPTSEEIDHALAYLATSRTKMREALLEIRRRHRDMWHGDGCVGKKHDLGDCECPDNEYFEGSPCVEDTCDCCMSVDIIANALDE